LADVIMPQLGESVTEGTVTKWLKAVGEPVERDEPLFEVSTDKVDSEVPSPDAGFLSEILVPEGETVDVGTVLAVIGAPAGPPGAAPEASSQPRPDPAATSGSQSPVYETPPSALVAGDGLPASDAGQSGGQILSPVLRRLLVENGIDPSDVPGSGPGGRVTRSDVVKVIEAGREASGTASTTGAVAPAAVPAAAPTVPPARPPTEQRPTAHVGSDEIVPFTNIRRRTAEHMSRSKTISAHALVVLEADYEQVERVRRSRGPQFKTEEGFSLTYLPFVARATVEALREWPNLNSSMGEDALIVHHQLNLGIAVDLDHEGLIVPVLHGAGGLTLRDMARGIRDLADRARGRMLGADDISGGTFSITNAGPFGTLLSGPVIYQPQVAVLSTDAVRRRPVVVAQGDGSEAIAIHSIGLLCLSWDARAIDGAYAAGFLARVVELLSTHDWDTEL
jgi:2-oxoglutarate dehydrogenase E2 component (dihydrolipoamide succinyltransferase)